MARLSASSEAGGRLPRCITSMAALGVRFCDTVAAASTMRSTRAPAPCRSPGMLRASGRFFQYFIGISARMAVGFTRAGLKMLS